MNKEEFLKTLSKKLEILEEKERTDTINEYRDTIEEKVRNGQTEEEAVADFGTVDELAKEILSAYKINPNYGKENDFFEKSEKVIKKGAKKLADFTEGIVEDVKDSDPNITLEKIFEIILRVFVVLIILAILRIPFEIVTQLSSSILSLGYQPAEWIFEVIFRIVLNVIYFVVCVLILAITIKKSLGKSGINVKKKQIEKKINEDDEKYEVYEERKDVESAKWRKTNWFSIIAKCFLGMFFLFPLSMICIGLLCGLSAFVVFCFQGFPFIGITILLFGIFLLMVGFLNVIWRLTFSYRTPHFSGIFISFIFITIGGILTMQTLFGLTYYDGVPENSFEQDKKIYQEKIEGEVYFQQADVIVDNTLVDFEYRIEVSYYPQFINVYLRKDDPSFDHYIYFTEMHTHNVERGRDMYHLIMDGLKEKKIYRYRDFYAYKISIYVNEKTKENIRFY